MECRHIKEYIIRYSSGDIEEREKVVVDEHVKACKDCSQYLLRSEKLWDTLDVWEDVEPGRQYIPEFWERVSSEESAPGGGLLGWLKSLKPPLAVTGALATIFIVGIFTFAVFGPGTLDMPFGDADDRDELILIELDRATSEETSEVLAIYGPWDNSFDANGNGGMN
jgi:hypothetical protein